MKALDHAGAYTRAAAALAVGRLGALQAEDKLKQLANSRQADGPAAKVAILLITAYSALKLNPRAKQVVRRNAHSTFVPIGPLALEQQMRIATLRGIGRRRESSREDEVRHSLKNAFGLEQAAAARVAGRMNLSGLRDVLLDLSKQRNSFETSARIALARMHAETSGSNAATKTNLLLQQLELSEQDMNFAVRAGVGVDALELRALREIADMVAEGNSKGEKNEALAGRFAFDADYASASKVALSKMTSTSRIDFLIRNIRTLLPVHDRMYDVQALGDQGAQAVPKILTAIASAREQVLNAPERHRYSDAGASLLMDALACIGDQRALPVLIEWSQDGSQLPRSLQHAQERARHIREVVQRGTPYTVAPDY